MLLRALLAAVIGTVAMTLSSTSEMHWRERQESTAPGRATLKILSWFGVPEPKQRAVKILSTWTHWLYGAGWGLLFWGLVDVAGWSLWAAGPVFFLAVWLTEQIHLPLMGIAPPSWRWGIKENLIDAWHHLVYAAGTVLGWVLIGLA